MRVDQRMNGVVFIEAFIGLYFDFANGCDKFWNVVCILWFAAKIIISNQNVSNVFAFDIRLFRQESIWFKWNCWVKKLFLKHKSSIERNHQKEPEWIQDFVRESITVRLTSCLTGLDLINQVNLFQIQHKQSSWIQTNTTGGQLCIATSHYKVRKYRVNEKGKTKRTLALTFNHILFHKRLIRNGIFFQKLPWNTADLFKSISQGKDMNQLPQDELISGDLLPRLSYYLQVGPFLLFQIVGAFN